MLSHPGARIAPFPGIPAPFQKTHHQSAKQSRLPLCAVFKLLYLLALQKILRRSATAIE